MSQESARTTRREFLRNAAAAAAVTTAATQVARSSVYSLAPARVLGANDRILLAHVGIGEQGRTHLRLLNERAQENNTQSIAVCDLYGRRLREEGDKYGVKESQRY